MKRDHIVDAAFEEFGKFDYDGASINAIIEQSNTSKGTFYHYFPSKKDLYMTLVRQVADEKMAYMQKLAVTSREKTPGTLFDMLRDQIEASIRFSAEYPHYARFSARIANETRKDIRKKIDAMVGGKTHELFNRLVREHLERRNLRDDLSADFITRIFIFMISRFNEFLQEMGVEIEVENMDRIMQVLNEYIDFLENGLAGKSLHS